METNGSSSNKTNGTSLACLLTLPGGIDVAYYVFPSSFVIICEIVLFFYVLWRYPRLRTTTNMLVASLNASDGIFGLASMLLALVNIKAVKNVLGDIRLADCYVLGACYSGASIGVVHMAILAVDRYIYIAYPFHYKKHVTNEMVFKIITGVWVVALVFEFIPVFAYTDDKYHQKCILSHPPVEYTLICATIYAACLVVVFVSYFKIARLAFAHKKASNARRLIALGTDDRNMAVTTRSAALKSVKFFVIIFGCFFVFTFPPVLALGINCFISVPDTVLMLLSCLFAVNSLSNFFVFVRVNKGFSEALRKIFSDIKICRGKAACSENTATSGLAKHNREKT